VVSSQPVCHCSSIMPTQPWLGAAHRPLGIASQAQCGGRGALGVQRASQRRIVSTGVVHHAEQPPCTTTTACPCLRGPLRGDASVSMRLL
jgi:hypothetical protein